LPQSWGAIQEAPSLHNGRGSPLTAMTGATGWSGDKAEHGKIAVTPSMPGPHRRFLPSNTDFAADRNLQAFWEVRSTHSLKADASHLERSSRLKCHPGAMQRTVKCGFLRCRLQVREAL
jgi:hypothetical protein